MKKLSLVIALTSLVSFAAETPAHVSPNEYTCEGDQTSFHYTTTSFVGTPTIRVTYKDNDVKLSPKVEIKVEPTRIGNLVSVSDFHMVPVDGPEVRYTLVLPQIQLAKMFDSVEFETVVVRTSVANPFFRPTPFTGTVHHNEFVNVKCTGRAVMF